MSDRFTIKNDFFWWKKMLSKNEINNINTHIQKNCKEDESPGFDKTLKFVDVKKIISYSKIVEIPKIKSIITNMKQANNYEFGFDLYDFVDTDGALYQIYNGNKKNEYKFHIDSEDKTYVDIKLTGIINLSTEKYTGGDFQLFLNGEITIDKFSEPGDIILFRSNIPHRVLPVTKGKRKTLTLFFYGPNWR